MGAMFRGVGRTVVGRGRVRTVVGSAVAAGGGRRVHRQHGRHGRHAAAGDGLAAAKAVQMVLKRSVYPQAWGLAFGVFCREHEAFTDRQKVQAAAKAALPDFPDRVLAVVPQTTCIFDDCMTGDVGWADAEVSEPARSEVPVLLMGGSLGGATPPSAAAVVATFLPNSQALVFPGFGHIVIAPECARTTIADFLNQPSGYDTSCVDNGRRPAVRHRLTRQGRPGGAER